MSLIHHRWLTEQLPAWEREGIVTADGARRLRERYAAEPPRADGRGGRRGRDGARVADLQPARRVDRPRLLVVPGERAAVAQWLLPLWGIWQHERVIARGTIVRIECIALDPYDPLRGRYLAVQPAGSRVPKPEGMEDGAAVPVWATLVAERLRDGKRTVAEVRLLDGRAVLTDILLDGVSVRELVEQQAFHLRASAP